MRIIVNIFLICTICSCDLVCPDWTEEKKQQFANECLEKSTIEHLTLQYHDYSFDEIDTVWILEESKGVLIDSFQLITKKLEYSALDYFSTTIAKNINIQNTFTIRLGNETFQLEGFGFEMRPEYTMCSKGYGCHLTSYTLDGNIFECNGSVPLVKRQDLQ